ncbi:hypothetical protein D1872_335530 [compost metagenome]
MGKIAAVRRCYGALQPVVSKSRPVPGNPRRRASGGLGRHLRADTGEDPGGGAVLRGRHAFSVFEGTYSGLPFQYLDPACHYR